ncbi:MAG: CehA/McbA family metallohydrolase, partial [Arenimonas sp.]|nr:CehA/McbA family metallohydrolase [Arenimonas sp.]
HAVNPSWSPDGATLFFVSNPEIAWGTGDVWSVPLRDPAKRTRILSEESSWSARPEIAPDGKRLLYSSYRGQQAHQLWLSTIDGAAPLPLTFGESDRRNARWSPDGRRIAYIGNARGNTELLLMEVIGGASRTITAAKRKYLAPRGQLVLDVVDESGQRIPSRVSVVASDGRAYAPDSAWMHADDGFDRALQSSETRYFHCAPPCLLELPPGKVEVTVQHGFAHAIWQGTAAVSEGKMTRQQVQLEARALPEKFGQWISADLHVHMNYGGHYRNTPTNLARQARAEDLDLVYDLIVNKEQRIPDIGYFRTDADPASNRFVTIMHGQEFHTSLWGHLALLRMNDHFLTPDFASYRHTAMASPYPHNGVIADLARAQNGLVGYVHPFDWPIVPEKEKSLTHQLPADVINGKVDYLEVVSFADHKATAEVWYRLLNLGFRLPAAAGTDAMANYASLRGPVGMNRVFLDTAGSRDIDAAFAALKSGQGFVSNSPLLGLLLDGRKPGQTVDLSAAGARKFSVALRSPVPVDHLELVHNGKVIKSFALAGDRRSFDIEGELELDKGGWLLLRAWNDGADPQVLDLYPYASTNPVHLKSPRGPTSVQSDAAYFAEWIDRAIGAVKMRTDFNDESEKRETVAYLKQASDAYLALAEAAGAPTP